ncbi:cysteine--tRNA ligase [Phycisphaerales bacterium AB-hyl4]|uniref:Cysteine--tRNA ligase n=1 Tax=Natronomicrosphaera hydrolytica TaxID=3242702 RepID=A0ABV4U486_9BACT
MMGITFYNTLTHRVEPFEPIEPGVVTMYNCGPTVYDFAHIGNFRAFVFADVLRRFLELAGYDVRQVMNITDVGHMTEDQLADGAGEDKMQVAMARMKEAKKAGSLTRDDVADPNDPYQIAAFYTKAFIEDSQQLKLKVADEPTQLPRATDHIEQMLTIIGKLVDDGHAYVAGDGAVYFSVEKFPDYGKLSGNTLDKLRGGAGGRIDQQHQAGKRHPADFLLWKPDTKHIMKWPSRFGEGYPGWHIECSAMALKLHDREQIDIHTGGEDNIFPHHECEIAQSCSYTGKAHFARYWMHTRFLLVEGQKMSKSKGNFFTVRDLLAKGVDPVVIRYELMKAHYRSNMNFTMKGLEDSASAVQKLRDAAAGFERKAGDAAVEVGDDHDAVRRFVAALADDLNVAGAIAVAFEYLREPDADAATALAVLRRFDAVLGVLPTEAGGQGDDDVMAKCADIDAARKQKDYATADRLRQELDDAGYDVRTGSEGTTASKRLA